MLNNIENEDTIMRDETSNSFPIFINYIRPRKRTYLDMLYSTNQALLNYRIDNYKINKYTENIQSSFNNINKDQERDNTLIKNFDVFNDINEAKKNLVRKKNLEYDEEKERRFVENYYRIKNAELNKLRFGTE